MAYLFSGATHQILRADAVVGTWPITLHARVRLTASDSNDHFLFGVLDTANGRGFYLRTSFTGGTQKARMTARDASGVQSSTTSTSLTVGTWHSVVGTATSATQRDVYLDNAGAGANITSISPASLARTSIGALDTGGVLSANIDHEIADVAIWSVILGAGDRAALAAGVSPALVRPDVLELYAPLIRGGQDRFGGEFTINNATVADHPRVFMPAAASRR
jgi:hypothetical protein